MPVDTKRKPANTAFKQQRLKAWQPILTPKAVLPTFFLIGLIFVPIGAVLYIAANGVNEMVMDYTNCNQQSSTYSSNNVPANVFQWKFVNGSCFLNISVAQQFTAPVFLYYRLSNFYQNHRRYVKSLSTSQLLGGSAGALTLSQLTSDCNPLDQDAAGNIYYPCGLIANSLFSDTIGIHNADFSSFTISGANTGPFTFSEKGIAWTSDADKYGSTGYTSMSTITPPAAWIGTKYRGNTINPGPWSNQTAVFDPTIDEHFQVWMRTAGLPTFRKLYGRSNTVSLPVDYYEIRIDYYFSVTGFGGTKSLVLSTTSWLGGKNTFLGSAYIVVGCICILLGIIFLIKHQISPRKLGDHSYLSWNQQTAASSVPASG